MTRGLVLGKFAPFHKGHEVLVRRSLATCDETVVLVYDSPQVTKIPLRTRAGWIRTLFPDAFVIEGLSAPANEGHDPAVMRLQENYIRSVVPLPITHFFSSEWYGQHVSRSLGAADVRVDGSRDIVPVSGTLLRKDPYAFRRFVSPVVYRDLVKRVVLVGAESTGKSTLAAALAGKLETVQVEEYGREFWVARHDAEGHLSPTQLLELAEEHRRREDEAILEARSLLICDTDARITRQYARFYHEGFIDPQLDALARDCPERYALAVLCGDDIPYVEDGTRSGIKRRKAAQAELREELQNDGGNWIEVHGSVEKRVESVRRAVEERGLSDWH
jgi:NadR type nicotinamide-nucleotide adenylyltransferase